jgi:hypothetical protein
MAIGNRKYFSGGSREMHKIVDSDGKHHAAFGEYSTILAKETYDPSVEFIGKFDYTTAELAIAYKSYCDEVEKLAGKEIDRNVSYKEFQEFLKDVLDGKYEGNFSDGLVLDDAIGELAERKYGEKSLEEDASND